MHSGGFEHATAAHERRSATSRARGTGGAAFVEVSIWLVSFLCLRSGGYSRSLHMGVHPRIMDGFPFLESAAITEPVVIHAAVSAPHVSCSGVDFSQLAAELSAPGWCGGVDFHGDSEEDEQCAGGELNSASSPA